jgi:hypothetical protein
VFEQNAKGGGSDMGTLQIVGLYIAMILGMPAHYLYNRLSQPLARRPSFDLGVFIAPIFLSPMVFIPLFETLKAAEFKRQASLMSLLVAFENGFFSASSEKSVGHRYAPMGAGSSVRAAREPDVGWRGFSFFLFAASCLSNQFALSGKRYAVDREFRWIAWQLSGRSASHCMPSPMLYTEPYGSV